MKKIMCLVAAIAMAVCSQAAIAITWQTGTGIKDVDGNAFATTTTGYTATILFFTDADCKNAVAGVTGNTANSYKSKGSAGFGGVTSESFEAGNTYYSKIEITAPNGNTYTTQVGSFSLAAGATSGISINYTSGLNMGGAPLLGEIKYVGGSDPTPDTPEPTSGLLLLVGGAVLALRRKQK